LKEDADRMEGRNSHASHRDGEEEDEDEEKGEKD
jgi:hypothetical protein